jgi:hypothetical protein
MAKFIQVQSVENTILYINVETIRYVAQHPGREDHCSIRFLGEASPLPINESAASIISRAGAD